MLIHLLKNVSILIPPPKSVGKIKIKQMIPIVLLTFLCILCLLDNHLFTCLEVFGKILLFHAITCVSRYLTTSHAILIANWHFNCIKSPLYDWKAMEKDGFSWWVRRLQRAQDLYDEFRIDHFRGFAGFWAVSAGAKVATNGRWKVGPRKSVFNSISRAIGGINIIAEDLGVITEDVVQLRKSIGAPGMAVLQFAFGEGADSPHLPHNHEFNQVVYTGTHDNDTIRGWWDSLKDDEKSKVQKYLLINENDSISWALIRVALSSVARTAIIPMQDILELGSSARMNLPATTSGNWSWRMPSSISFNRLNSEAAKLRDLLSMYGRASIDEI